MQVVEYMKLWFNGIIKPDEAIKIMKKKKYGIRDGIVSAAALGLVLGFIFALTITLTTGGDLLQTWAVGIILIPVIIAIGVLIFSGLFRFIANYLGGTGTIETTTGFFGIFIGIMAISMVPMIIFNGIAGAIMISSSTLALLLIALGTLTTAALGGIANGLMYEMISTLEKAKLPRTGLIYGTTTGILTATIVVLSMLLVGSEGALMSMLI